MTKEAIARGTAKWIERNVLPNLTPHGAMRTMLKGALNLATVNPDAAIALLSAKFPMLPTLVDAAGSDATFSAVMSALKEATREEEGMVLQFVEIGLWNNPPHSLAVKPEHIEELEADIRSAESALKAGGVQ